MCPAVAPPTLRRPDNRPAPGRPRDPQLDAAIVQATLQLFADSGYGAVTMEAVATLAGVGKATLYRRYPGKAQMVVDAVTSVIETAPEMPGASVHDELVALLETIRRKSGSLSARIFPQLLSAGAENPEMMALYREQVADPRRARFTAVLVRAVQQGLLRADVDLGYACDLMVGPVVYRNLVRTELAYEPGFAARVVTDVLAALRPRPDRLGSSVDDQTCLPPSTIAPEDA